MNPVSDDLLLAAAQTAATLMGLLLVGVIFFADAGMRALRSIGPEAGWYFRSGTRFVLLLYSFVLLLSLAQIAFEPPWVAGLFAVTGLTLIVALGAFTRAAGALRGRLPRMHAASLWIAWPPVVALLAVPVVVDGAVPGREPLLISMLIAGALAFAYTASLVLLSFELTAISREIDGAE
ncbi:MAG TPA: hypothetical protein VLA76_02485 [Candidatus Angelobacter sp.]|nr:hypothetical protein [Candidatus Angelobacter sp.]